MEETVSTAYKLLETLVHGNNVIQEWVITNFDALCDTQFCGQAVANMLHKVGTSLNIFNICFKPKRVFSYFAYFFNTFVDRACCLETAVTIQQL